MGEAGVGMQPMTTTVFFRGAEIVHPAALDVACMQLLPNPCALGLNLDFQSVRYAV